MAGMYMSYDAYEGIRRDEVLMGGVCHRSVQREQIKLNI